MSLLVLAAPRDRALSVGGEAVAVQMAVAISSEISPLAEAHLPARNQYRADIPRRLLLAVELTGDQHSIPAITGSLAFRDRTSREARIASIPAYL
jgi:hypothetical protein